MLTLQEAIDLLEDAFVFLDVVPCFMENGICKRCILHSNLRYHLTKHNLDKDAEESLQRDKERDRA